MAHEASELIETVLESLYKQRELLHANLVRLSADITSTATEDTLSDEGRSKMTSILKEESEACSREFKKVTDFVISLRDIASDLERGIESRSARRLVAILILDSSSLKNPLSNELISNLKAAIEMIKIKL